jgi:mRNA-degrading endonuclease RelE of RelBE toxin-antitoxin system
VLVAVEDLQRLEETLAIMRDADTMRRLAESDAELARGEEVTAAELAETIRHRPLLEQPHRVGKQLLPPLDDRFSARRGTYRVIYRIDDKTHVVTVVDIGTVLTT